VIDERIERMERIQITILRLLEEMPYHLTLIFEEHLIQAEGGASVRVNESPSISEVRVSSKRASAPSPASLQGYEEH